MSIRSSSDYEEEGRVLLATDKPHEALAVFEEGSRRFPGDDDLRMGVALAVSRLGEHAKACHLLEELRVLHPGSSDVLQALTEAYLNRGMVEKAKAAADEAVNAPTADARTVSRFARAFYESRRRQEALTYYEKTATLAPDWGEAWFGLGACLWALKHGPAAEAALRRAVELQPDDQQARQFWGCVLHDLGRRDEARTALEAVPLDAPWQRAALERLVALGWWPNEPERAKAFEALWHGETVGRA